MLEKLHLMMTYSYVGHWSNCGNCSGPIVEFHEFHVLKNIALSSQALDGHTFSTVSMTKGAVLITDHGLIIMSVT